MTRKSLHLKFIAGVTATALALTSLSAAPARAEQDAAKVIGALVGLAILGTVINDRKKDKQQHVAPIQHKPIAKPIAKPRPKAVPARFLLPSRCLRTVNKDNGKRIRVFGERCLNRHYDFARSLPQRCARADWGRERLIYSYGARCLKKRGYQLARR